VTSRDLARLAAVLFGFACIGLFFRSIIVNAFLSQLRHDLVARWAWVLTEAIFRLFISPRSAQARIDRTLAWFWPVVQFTMIYLWYLLVIAGFGAINWGLGASPTVRQALVASGSAASTLGFSTPGNLQGEIVAIIEGGIGLFLVVFLLTFIPDYLSAQQSRSDQTSRVYARAGAPPTGAALVEWYYRSGKGGALDDSCAAWETWVRDFGLAHSQSPELGLTRAHRSAEYWVSAVVAMMDAAAIAKDVLDVPEVGADLPGRRRARAPRRGPRAARGAGPGAGGVAAGVRGDVQRAARRGRRGEAEPPGGLASVQPDTSGIRRAPGRPRRAHDGRPGAVEAQRKGRSERYALKRARAGDACARDRGGHPWR
jgi:hypothetical protein